ncbi:MAG: GNAT family N-acetyltransferase [Hyphomicrobiales bacterium]
MIPELATERLILRGWMREDFPAYAAFYGNADFTRYIGGPCTPAQAWHGFCAMIGEWQLHGFGTLAIEVRASGETAGYAGLWFPPDIDEPELCWGLFEGYHGKGYATEAVRRVQVWAQQVLGMPALMSFVHPENFASRKVAERLGAYCESETELRGSPRLFMRHVLPLAEVETVEV